MPKPDRNLTELKRQVRLLLALDGRVLRLPGGLWLVRDGRVRDALALQSLLQRREVARNELKSCFTDGAHCEPVSRQHLAAATHALSVLEVHADELEATPARWLAGQRRDRAWLAAQRQRVQQLSAWMLAPADGAALAAWHNADAMPPLDARGEALAWLCDSPPTHAVDLGGIADAAFAQVLQRVAMHGPRESDRAAALILATCDWPADARDAWWPWLAQGVDPFDVAAWPADRRAQAAPPRDWPLPAVSVYLRLSGALLHAPGGSKLKLAPDQFARLAGGRKTTLLALASALDQVLRSDPGAIEQTLALADAALRLDARWSMPEAAPLHLGLGASIDPGFVDWLGGAALVDRYLSLREALGEPLEISRRLRQDYLAGARAAGERTFLATLAADDPRRGALARRVTGDTARTRRRLETECRQLELRWRMRQVDGALRDALARAVGSPSPRWDEAWRDAARLYLAVDLNHAELKGLLRAAASGDAAAWRLRLPGNAGWLARAAARLDAEAWLAPPTHAFPWRGAACTLAAERDPLQALRMGLPFDSCLAIDDGCNRHSAIINALDANKWVIYLRDSRGRILARQLIAVSSDWRLVGYRVYTSIGTADGLIDAFNEYARALAAQCGIELADSGVPETLNGREWYDDGTHAWIRAEAGESARLIEAYLSELGIAAPEIPDLDLADEARRWALARDGHVAALRNWFDARPSGLRNLALLQARYGRERLLRLLGDDYRRDRYRLEAAGEPTLGELLRLRRQLCDPDRAGFGRNLDEVIFDRASIHRAIGEVLAQPAGIPFADDGLEHALLTILPRWAELLSFPALAAELPLLASTYDRLTGGLPEDCAACVRVSQHSLLRALRAAWRREPDPGRMLRLLRQRHASTCLPRWLLALGAREHLAQPAALPLFAPPLPDREVLRAIDALIARFPPLRVHTLRLAATLRHSDPATLDPESIDWPDAPPWEALGDAICDWPGLWPALRRYARRPGDLSECTAAEACWASHVATAWRDALPAQVAALDDDSEAASQILAGIGNLALVDEARELLRRHAHRARRNTARAQRVAEMLSAAGRSSLDTLRRAWLMREAAARKPGASALAAHPDARALVDALIELPTAPAWGNEFLAQCLPRSFDPYRYRRLWQHPGWRPLADLAAPQAWSASHARRLLQQWPEELGNHWLLRELQTGNTDLLGDGPLAWYRQLAALARTGCTREQWQALFAALPDALAATAFAASLPPAE